MALSDFSDLIKVHSSLLRPRQRCEVAEAFSIDTADGRHDLRPSSYSDRIQN
jgi:hypothetical protein